MTKSAESYCPRNRFQSRSARGRLAAIFTPRPEGLLGSIAESVRTCKTAKAAASLPTKAQAVGRGNRYRSIHRWFFAEKRHGSRRSRGPSSPAHSLARASDGSRRDTSSRACESASDRTFVASSPAGILSPSSPRFRLSVPWGSDCAILHASVTPSYPRRRNDAMAVFAATPGHAWLGHIGRRVRALRSRWRICYSADRLDRGLLGSGERAAHAPEWGTKEATIRR